MENLGLVIVIWLTLGVHSAWFLVRRITYNSDLTTREAPMLVICLIFPIITHFATYLTYPKPDYVKRTVIFKQQTPSPHDNNHER